MSGDPAYFKMETAAERASRERRELEKKGLWHATLYAQDHRLALNDVIRGPEKTSFTDSCRTWFGGHRF